MSHVQELWNDRAPGDIPSPAEHGMAHDEDRKDERDRARRQWFLWRMWYAITGRV